MNRLFVAYKPAGISSNAYLTRLKAKYGVKKAGFSGTLDPFAKGVLVVGLGACTKLFRFLRKTPKVYRATLWLGLRSDSLDTQNVREVVEVNRLSYEAVYEAVTSLKGEIAYEPPAFSAKHIAGRRAYDLARAGEKVTLPKITSHIFDATLLHYRHPFVTFSVTVSEGTYVRSLGAIIAKRLGTFGALSALERQREGAFVYTEETPLEVRRYLDLQENFYAKDFRDLEVGKKLALEDFTIRKPGTYFVDAGKFLSVVTIEGNSIKYEIGSIRC